MVKWAKRLKFPTTSNIDVTTLPPPLEDNHPIRKLRSCVFENVKMKEPV